MYQEVILDDVIRDLEKSESLFVFIDIRKQEVNMSSDISSMYTKDQNMKAGRRGYFLWKDTKETAISPAAYGDYVLQRKRGKKK